MVDTGVTARLNQASEAETSRARVVASVGAPFGIEGRPVALHSASAVVVLPRPRLDDARIANEQERDVIEAALEALERAQGG